MPTTIQLSDERKAQLQRLKVGGLTYDDVVGQLLTGIDEDEFRRLALRWEADLAKAIRSNRANRPI